MTVRDVIHALMERDLDAETTVEDVDDLLDTSEAIEASIESTRAVVARARAAIAARG